MLCNMFFYVVQHIFQTPSAAGFALSAKSARPFLHFLQTPAGECTKSSPTESITRHRRDGERVALRHYLARAAMERTAHRIPGTHYVREQICTAILRAGTKENARDFRKPRASNPYYL